MSNLGKAWLGDGSPAALEAVDITISPDALPNEYVARPENRAVQFTALSRFDAPTVRAFIAERDADALRRQYADTFRRMIAETADWIINTRCAMDRRYRNRLRRRAVRAILAGLARG